MVNVFSIIVFFSRHPKRIQLRYDSRGQATSKVCGSIGNRQWKIRNSESFFGYLIQILNGKRNRYRSLSSCLKFIVETRVSRRFSVKPNYFQYRLGIFLLSDLELSQVFAVFKCTFKAMKIGTEAKRLRQIPNRDTEWSVVLSFPMVSEGYLQVVEYGNRTSSYLYTYIYIYNILIITCIHL